MIGRQFGHDDSSRGMQGQRVERSRSKVTRREQLAELLGSLSLATEAAVGVPPETTIRAAVVSVALATDTAAEMGACSDTPDRHTSELRVLAGRRNDVAGNRSWLLVTSPDKGQARGVKYVFERRDKVVHPDMIDDHAMNRPSGEDGREAYADRRSRR